MKGISVNQTERSIRALIVDDEPPARRRLTRMLEEIGGVDIVGQARTPNEIAQTLDLESGVDVVFLDINMPGESGMSLRVDWVHQYCRFCHGLRRACC